MPSFKQLAAKVSRTVSRTRTITQATLHLARIIIRAPIEVIRDSFKGQNFEEIAAALTTSPSTTAVAITQSSRSAIPRKVIGNCSKPISILKQLGHFTPLTAPEEQHRAWIADIDAPRSKHVQHGIYNSKARFSPIHRAALKACRRKFSVREPERQRDETPLPPTSFNNTILPSEPDPEVLRAEAEQKEERRNAEWADTLRVVAERGGWFLLPNRDMLDRLESLILQGYDPQYQNGFQVCSAWEKNELIAKWNSRQQEIFQALQQALFKQQQALEVAEVLRQASLRFEALLRLARVGGVIGELLAGLDALRVKDKVAFRSLAKKAVEQLWLPIHSIFSGLTSPIKPADIDTLGWPLEKMEQTLVWLNGRPKLSPEVTNFRDGLEAILQPIAAVVLARQPVAKTVSVAPSNNPFLISTPALSNSNPFGMTTFSTAAAVPRSTPFTNTTHRPFGTAPAAPAFTTTVQPASASAPVSNPAVDKAILVAQLTSTATQLNTFMKVVDRRAKARSGLSTKQCDDISKLLQLPLAWSTRTPVLEFSGSEAGRFGVELNKLWQALNRVKKRDGRFEDVMNEVERCVMFLNP